MCQDLTRVLTTQLPDNELTIQSALDQIAVDGSVLILLQKWQLRL